MNGTLNLFVMNGTLNHFCHLLLALISIYKERVKAL